MLIGTLAGTVDMVVAGVEYAVIAAADLADALRLPGAGLLAARLLRDKISLRQAQVGSGLREVAFREVTSAEQVSSFLTQYGSIVLKPANRQASLGVHLVHAGDDISLIWEECVGADEGYQVADRPMRWRYLVEERLVGPEVSVESLVAEGQVVWTNLTQKETLGGVCPIEVGHTVGHSPGDWPQRMQQLVTTIGYQTGILHAEWILDPAGVSLVECAGRPPGDHIPELIDLAFGGKILIRWLELMRGVWNRDNVEAQRGAAVRFLLSDGPGAITSVSGIEDAKQSVGITKVEVSAEVGRHAQPLRSSWDRLGYVIAVGENAEEARRHALAASRLVKIRVS